MKGGEVRTSDLKIAIKECERFLERARLLAKMIKEDVNGSEYPISFPKESGSVRRSSMDLTRALADLRKSRWQSRVVTK